MFSSLGFRSVIVKLGQLIGRILGSPQPEPVALPLRTSWVEELLGQGLRVRMPATGGSMLPHILPGSVLTVSPLAQQQRPRDGAIVLYRDGRRLFAHRMLRRTRNSMPPGQEYVFRGDNLPSYDRPSSGHRILGIVEHVQAPIIRYRSGLGVRGALRAARSFANLAAARVMGRSGLPR